MGKNILITIIVPVFNEEKTVHQLLAQLTEVIENKIQKRKNWPTELIIVDDGSTDNSYEILTKIIKGKQYIRLLRHKRNRGKGSAISTSLKESKGKIIIIQDADLEYNPSEIPRLLFPIVSGKTDVVFGSRFLNYNKYNGLWANLLGNVGLSLISTFLLQRKITDLMTCYKAFRIDLLDNISSNSFDVEPEITAKLLYNRNVRFLEIPISYNPRVRGKKIKKIHGLISLWRLLVTIYENQKDNLLSSG